MASVWWKYMSSEKGCPPDVVLQHGFSKKSGDDVTMKRVKKDNLMDLEARNSCLNKSLLKRLNFF